MAQLFPAQDERRRKGQPPCWASASAPIAWVLLSTPSRPTGQARPFQWCSRFHSATSITWAFLGSIAVTVIRRWNILPLPEYLPPRPA